ncbi:hypothetical protein Q5752_004209 [Cryptotrichosporon argae]
MILGIGIDILSLARFQAVIERRGALALGKRICTRREFEELEALSGAAGAPLAGTRPEVRFLSARWAAKEAAYKALSPLRPLWKSLDLSYLPSGQPKLHLVDAQLGDKPPALLTTISHDGGVVVAVVVAQSPA